MSYWVCYYRPAGMACYWAAQQKVVGPDAAGANFTVTGGSLTNALSLSSAPNPSVTTAVVATLVSATTQSVTIANSTVIAVTYRFGVDGIIVETGSGTLQINLAVE